MKKLAVVRLVAFALTGASLAVLIAGNVKAKVGPFDTTLSLRPALAGSTTLRLAPLGSIELDTHDAPLGLELRVDALRVEEAERIARDPEVLGTLEEDIAGDARRALRLAAARGVFVALMGGAIGAFAARAQVRSVAAGGAIGAAAAAVLGLTTTMTFDASSVAEPRYSGLMTVAPTAVGDVEGVVERFGEYRAQLTELVGNVVALYRTAQGLPNFEVSDDTIRLLHVSDIHLNPQAFDLIDLIAKRFGVDAVADTGDITDWGSEPETQLLTRIGKLDIPYVWVRGNHDSHTTQAAVASQPNAIVLDASARDVAGLRFWGFADTRFTPNKDQPTGKSAEARQAQEGARALANAFALAGPASVDVVMVHDSRMAAKLPSGVPLVLSGHTHNARETRSGRTRVLVEGSTGGAGLRGLQGKEPEPLTCSLLYFDRASGRLVAYDRISVRGLGETGASIERHVTSEARDASEHTAPTWGRMAR